MIINVVYLITICTILISRKYAMYDRHILQSYLCIGIIQCWDHHLGRCHPPPPRVVQQIRRRQQLKPLKPLKRMLIDRKSALVKEYISSLTEMATNDLKAFPIDREMDA